MPRVRGVKSLLASCVDEIVNNIYYWIKMYLETCREERKMTHLKFASPFVSLRKLQSIFLWLKIQNLLHILLLHYQFVFSLRTAGENCCRS